MNAVMKRRIISHLWRQRGEQMSDSLLLRDINIEVADHDDPAIGTNAFLAAAELTRSHISFHDVDPVFLIERHSGDFIETHHIVKAD